jgi:hypothetical protein
VWVTASQAFLYEIFIRRRFSFISDLQFAPQLCTIQKRPSPLEIGMDMQDDRMTPEEWFWAIFLWLFALAAVARVAFKLWLLWSS